MTAPTPNPQSSPANAASWGMPPASPTGPTPPFGPGKPSRRRTFFTHTLVALIALGIGAGIGGNSDAAKQTSGPAPTATVTRTATATVTPTAAAPKSGSQDGSSTAVTVAGDGEYMVGQDMQPGTYKTAGPATGSLGDCYWERDKDSSGSMSSIIANDNLAGSGRVTVNKGEIFKSKGCQDWSKVG